MEIIVSRLKLSQTFVRNPQEPQSFPIARVELKHSRQHFTPELQLLPSRAAQRSLFQLVFDIWLD